MLSSSSLFDLFSILLHCHSSTPEVESTGNQVGYIVFIQVQSLVPHFEVFHLLYFHFHILQFDTLALCPVFHNLNVSAMLTLNYLYS